jgi:dTDP-4-amino-4,6-dideoxygalactose transaminase
MKPIKFNSNCKSNSYTSHFELLNSDYTLFRDKHFSNKCLSWLKDTYTSSHLLLTHSATGGLEVIAQLIDIKDGDEVIMPSFTFVSSANAFVSRGATPVFVDIDEQTLNLSLDFVEKAITPRTKAIVAMHYIGHACDLDRLRVICDQHNLFLIEDAAMGFGAYYQDKPLGSIGDFGVISFDITKQISAIQGGLLLINNVDYIKRANQIYHNGTNRIEFESGEIPYYEWVGMGSKYQMNELNAAFLYEQLMNSEEILNYRKKVTQWYHSALLKLAADGYFRIMDESLVATNVHAYYLIFNTKKERVAVQEFLKSNQVESLFHYIPLHLSSYGEQVGNYIGLDNSEKISEALLRLPFHAGISYEDVDFIVLLIKNFYDGR